MSENGTNVWRKRVNTSIKCPSGKIVVVKRPGPEMALKAGKILRIFQSRGLDAATATLDKQLEVIESLSDSELDDLTVYARVLLVNVVVDPPLFLKPKADQLEPDDLPLGDFWFLAFGGMNGWPTMPVKLADGEETTVAAVEAFPPGQGPSDGTGSNSEQVQQASI